MGRITLTSIGSRRATRLVAIVLLANSIGGCAEIGPGVFSRQDAIEVGLGPDPAVVVVTVVGLRQIDFEAEHPDGGPLLTSLQAALGDAARWDDTFVNAAGGAGLWSLVTGAEARSSLDEPARALPTLGPNWITRIGALPPSLASQPELRQGEWATADVLDTDALLEALEALTPKPRSLTWFALDPWPPRYPGAPVVSDRRLTPRQERLRRLDAPLAQAILHLARGGHTVALTGLLESPSSSPDRGSTRKRSELRVPLAIWSSAPAFPVRLHPQPVQHRALLPTLRSLAQHERGPVPLFHEEASPRLVFWWGDDRGGLWWENEKEAVRIEGDRFACFDRTGDPGARVDLSAGEPERAARLLETVRATVGEADRRWELWVKGSDQLDLIESTLRFHGSEVEVEGSDLEEIDELRPIDGRTVALFLAAEPDGDVVRLVPTNPFARFTVHVSGEFHGQPVFGAPIYVGSHHRGVGLNKAELGGLGRNFWLARVEEREPTRASWWNQAPPGMHFVRVRPETTSD